MEVNNFILTEALSAILGVTVNLHSDRKDLKKANQLQITSLTALALLDKEASIVGHLTSSMKLLSVDKKSKEALKRSPVSSSLRKELFVISDDFFDPVFDFDFTNMSEPKHDDECMRGDEPYKRPYGWMRFALKVRDKYPDGNTWLGTNGWRSRSDSGEWPVSYHGTGLEGAEGIIQNHFKAGDREVYGRGIYSSPNIEVADMFAQSKTFTSQNNGKMYKVIMQNRINPQKREIKDKQIWLVPIPLGTKREETQIVMNAIRPYGLLLKEVS